MSAPAAGRVLVVICGCMYCAGAEDQDSSISMDTGRKDSLSLNVEFVKVNISRNRKGFVPSDILSSAANMSFTSSSGKLANVDSQTAANIVRFSGKIIKNFLIVVEL